MPLAFPSAEFTQWVQTACTSTEQRSIGSGFMPDLPRYGVPRKDPELVKLVQGKRLPGPSAISVNLFVWPEKISSAPRRTRKIWFGIVQVAGGPQAALGRWLVAKAWTWDPGINLVNVENELLAIAAREFP
jgi:hypothetical protein